MNKRWSKEELNSLMTFVKDEDHVRSALLLWISENPTRTIGSANAKYYGELSKLTTKTNKMTTITTSAGARANKQWNGEEERALKQYILEGKNYDQISNLLHRSVAAISCKVSEFNSANKKLNTEKTTRIPIQDYVKMHPEQFPQPTIVQEPAVTAEKPKKQSYNILTGSEIRVKIVGMRIEGSELVINI